MSFEVHVVFQDAFLHVRITGKNSRETVAAYLTEVRELCQKLARTDVLIEENLQGPGLSIADVYKVVTTAGKDLWPTVKRVAYVDVNPEHSAGLMRFAGNIGFNLGINVHVFQTVIDARTWLDAQRGGN